MPALSYSKENIEKYDFENKIINGIKKHTIRRYGPGLTKRPFRVGDTLYHYRNWRTPQRFKFHVNKCLYVADFRFIYADDKKTKCIIFINNKPLNPGWGLYSLSTNDGFENNQQFKNFFIKAGLPFHGQLIGWAEDINYE